MQIQTYTYSLRHSARAFKCVRNGQWTDTGLSEFQGGTILKAKCRNIITSAGAAHSSWRRKDGITLISASTATPSCSISIEYENIHSICIIHYLYTGRRLKTAQKPKCIFYLLLINVFYSLSLVNSVQPLYFLFSPSDLF